MTYIEEYYKWITDNPNKVCKKIKNEYSKLVEDIKKPKQVSFLNKLTNETEVHTYSFDEHKGHRVINFIEKYCRQSKGKWAGKPLKLELFQKAMLEAAFGFVDENGFRKYKKVVFFVARKTMGKCRKTIAKFGISYYHKNSLIIT